MHFRVVTGHAQVANDAVSACFQKDLQGSALSCHGVQVREGVQGVKLVEVDAVGLKQPQAFFQLGPGAGGIADGRLARQEDLVATIAEHPAHLLLGVAVGRCDIEVVNPCVNSVMPQADRLVGLQLHQRDAAEADNETHLVGIAKSAVGRVGLHSHGSVVGQAFTGYGRCPTAGNQVGALCPLARPVDPC